MKSCFYMPNNRNLLVFRGDNAQIINNYLTDDCLDFRKIIPLPKTLYDIGDVDDILSLEFGSALICYENGILTAFDKIRRMWNDKTNSEIHDKLNKNSQYRKYGENALSNIAKYGHSNDESWNTANWGDVDTGIIEVKIIETSNIKVQMLFDSPSPPLPIFRKLVSLHDLSLDVLCCDDNFIESYSFYNNNEQEFQYEGRKANAMKSVLGRSNRKVHKYKRLTSHERLFLK